MPNLTVNDILVDAYQEASATPEYKSGNVLWLKHIHLTVQDIWENAVKLKKAYRNWDIWTADTVSLQDEYTKPSVSSTTVGASHIETVSIAYGSTTYSETGNKKYIPCRPALDYEIANWNYYLENQDINNPIYFSRDLSVFIAPDPRSDEVWTARLQITGIRSIASGSWTTSTTETEMKLPITMIDTIKLWLISRILAWHNRDENLKTIAEQKYEKSRDANITNMFTEEPFINEFPK